MAQWNYGKFSERRFGAGIHAGFLGQTAANNRALIYKGTIPSDADDYTEAGYTSDLLATFSNFSGGHDGYGRIYASSIPASVIATGTGTASWAALFNTATPTRVALCTVTTSGNGGVLYIDNINIASGNTVAFVSFGFDMNSNW